MIGSGAARISAKMIDHFEAYLLKLRETPRAEQTEHTSRAALEALLDQFAKDASKSLRVQHEPKREKDKRAPDFKIALRRSRGTRLHQRRAILRACSEGRVGIPHRRLSGARQI